jgi:hypothetical protein
VDRQEQQQAFDRLARDVRARLTAVVDEEAAASAAELDVIRAAEVLAGDPDDLAGNAWHQRASDLVLVALEEEGLAAGDGYLEHLKRAFLERYRAAVEGRE